MPRTFDERKLFYGMNIHPQYINEPWSQRPAAVIAELHELGCTVARIDCYGLESEALLVLDYVKEAVQKDILVVPCLAYGSTWFQNDPDSNYKAAKSCGELTAEILKDYCPIYEVTNEISGYCNGVGPGTDPALYDGIKYADCRELIRGVIDGIKSVQPDAKIIIGGGITTLTAFYRMLWFGTAPDGTENHPVVRWDYTSWHWYQSSGTITEAFDGTEVRLNVLAELAKFGVPIWITELGFIPGITHEEQSAYVKSALAEYRGYYDSYKLVNICWYALYDDATGTFGLISAPPEVPAVASANWDPKEYSKIAMKKVAEEQTKSQASSGSLKSALTKKLAHESFKSYVQNNPDEGLPGKEFHTAEYELPMALYQNLKEAAARNNVSENEELVKRLESTFAPGK